MALTPAPEKNPARPQWSEAPAWAKFVQQDMDGRWFWSEVAATETPHGYEASGRWMYCTPRREQHEIPPLIAARGPSLADRQMDAVNIAKLMVDRLWIDPAWFDPVRFDPVRFGDPVARKAAQQQGQDVYVVNIQDGWRPMQTAPVSGLTILIKGKLNGCDDEQEFAASWNKDWHAWQTRIGQMRFAVLTEVSGWMPSLLGLRQAKP